MERDLSGLTNSALVALQEETSRQSTENSARYRERYGDTSGDNHANYGASINDDYNGEGAEHTELSVLSNAIGLEVAARKTRVTVPCCPKCGGMMTCTHEDTSDDNRSDGRADYFDLYKAICTECSHEESVTKEGGTSEQENYETHCPFCGMRSAAHP